MRQPPSLFRKIRGWQQIFGRGVSMMMPLYSFDLLPGPAGNTNHEMLGNDIEARAAAYRMARELARNRKCSSAERVVVTDLYGAVVNQVFLHTASII
jgi:hypothetical protein